ncbi:MAG: metallophosphatase domain-containing protein [Chloroflexi bacterium]|nr:metallophosphatase domain-containing protein [Chloroflexota bacterium]MBP8058453.1 metallophosphatase domain-containing protein [Chloroflexota bacterium]
MRTHYTSSYSSSYELTIVAISDTHGLHHLIDIPPGDVLIHSGDLSATGTLSEVAEFNAFLGSLPHRHKIVVAGNHDLCFEQQPAAARAILTNAIYLEDEAVTLEGLKFYGSPWQPRFLDWAFNLDRGPEIRAKWELIPPDTDVLITHGPPYGIRDYIIEIQDRVGCEDLLEVVAQIRPRYHFFGHIHDSAGVTMRYGTTFVNSSICDMQYQPVHRAIVCKTHLPRPKPAHRAIAPLPVLVG